MSWTMANYAWKLGTLELDDVAHSVVLVDEGGGSWVDSSYRVPARDGRRVDLQGPIAPMNLMLQLTLKEAGANGTVTHTNGVAGHLYENLSKIQAKLNTRSLVALTRTDPHAGNVRALVRKFAPIFRGPDHITYMVPLMVPSGSWQDAAETSSASTSVTTSGDTIIHDPIVVLASATTLTHTSSDGVQSAITGASGPTYPVTIDIGAGTAVDNASADARGYVTFSQPWGLRMEPALAQTFSGTATIKYRNRWS